MVNLQRLQVPAGGAGNVINALVSYTLTHDMRAPLRAMEGFGKVLLGECTDRIHADRRDLIRRVAESAARMDKLITGALDFNKIMRHQFDLLPVDAAALLRGLVESYPQFHPPQAEVVIAGDFPRVVANESGLAQVFTNLLANAVKFVEPSKMPQVRVWAEVRGDYARLWFEGNGIGVAKEYQDRIGVMFQRLSKSYEGTDIGLALVSKTVERMRGKTGVESEPGKGSRFWGELKRGLWLRLRFCMLKMKKTTFSSCRWPLNGRALPTHW